MENPSQSAKKIEALDVRIAVSVLICLLSAELLNVLNLKIAYNGMHLEIIQHLTAGISCCLVCQATAEISKKAAVNRLIITAIGGIMGILIAVTGIWINNGWFLAAATALGVLLTLFFCKCAGVPYVNARIGGVTCILVAGTLSGTARILYALLRFVSTLYGALIAILVTMLFAACRKK